MIHFDKLLSRADIPTLEQLIGKSAVKLLQSVDDQLVRGPTLRKILTDLYPAYELLTDRATRGTVVDLMREEETTALLEELGLDPTSDPYSQIKNLRVRRGSDPQTVFLGYFGVSPPAPMEKDLAPDSLRLDSSYGLFAHQREAARQVKRALRKGARRVLLHMPTGAGKTRTAMHVIAEHLATEEPTVAIWLAYSEELCEQAASEFERAWKIHGNRDVTLCRFWGGREPSLRECRDGFIVAGLSKVYSRTIADLQFIGRLADRVSLVIIDEAHQAIAETYGLVLDTLHRKQARTALLGLTATPGRTWADIDKDRELAEFFDNKKVTLRVAGYPNPVEYLISEGYLARPYFRQILHESKDGLSDADLKAIERELDIPARVLAKLAKDELRNLRTVIEVEQLANRHKRILVFAATVEHARLLATALHAHGKVAARVVTGDTPTEERRNTVEWFKASPEHCADEVRVLCNFGVLTTGFDAPQTSAAVVARPTTSLVLYSQMVGRAIRGPRAGGKPNAEIVTIVDTGLPGFGDIAEAFLNWEDAGWESPNSTSSSHPG